MVSACCNSLVGDTIRSHDRSAVNFESHVKTNFRHLFLWLFVINLGIALGAGLYESRVVIPQWANLPPRTWPNTGIRFWVYVTTIPLTLLTVANLVAAWLERSPKRKWWLWAAVTIMLERVATFAYFIPTMISLMGSERSDLEIKAALSQWLAFNYGRHVLTFLGWLLALKALSLPGDNRNTTGA
jgi:hypothetical protein